MKTLNGRQLRTVWILGAGFSRSLGGPLLATLFRQQDRGDLREMYPTSIFTHLADDCYFTQRLYHRGKEEGAWEHAEEFLELLASANYDDALSKSICRMYSQVEGDRLDVNRSPLDELTRRAKRALAAECSRFTAGADMATERWLPYEMWMRALVPGHDKIITFNYDNVLERVAEPGKHEVLLPQTAESQASRTGCVPIAKLHGSVLWRYQSQKCQAVDMRTALQDDEATVAIGVPGIRKMDFVRKVCAPLWSLAERWIASAEAVVFLGYRFPQTDSESRRRILGAMRGGAAPSCLHITVVLGPNRLAPDVVRTERLIEASAGRYRRLITDEAEDKLHREQRRESTLCLSVEPLYAEDYLSLCEEGGPLSQLKW